MSTTRLIVIDVEVYLKPGEVREAAPNLSFPERLLESTDNFLADQLDRVGNASRVILAETSSAKAEPTEELKHNLAIVQQVFQHKLGDKVEVLLDPFWQLANKASKDAAQQAPNSFATAMQFDEESKNKFCSTMEKYGLNDLVVMTHRAAKALPDLPNQRVEVYFLNRGNIEENREMVKFFEDKRNRALLPVSVKKITFSYVTKNEAGELIVDEMTPNPAITGLNRSINDYESELKHTTAKALHDLGQLPADHLIDAKKIMAYLPNEVKPVLNQVATKPSATPKLELKQSELQDNQSAALLQFKNKKTTIQEFLATCPIIRNTKEAQLSDADIMGMLLSIAKLDFWSEKGKDVNPAHRGERHVPDGIMTMRTKMPKKLSELADMAKNKLRNTIQIFGWFTPKALSYRSETTTDFYELIVALDAVAKKEQRGMAIKAFCFKYCDEHPELVFEKIMGDKKMTKQLAMEETNTPTVAFR